MTTIIGIKKNGEVYLASDSLGTSGILQRDHGAKFVKGKNFALAYSYSYRVPQLIHSNIDNFNCPKSWMFDEVLKFSEWLRKLLQEHGAKKEGEKDEMVLHPVSIILASKSKIFVIDPDYSCFEVKDFVAEGSGREFAYGALNVLYRMNLSPKRISELSIKTASKFDKNTGGRVCLLKL